ncbi:MAG: ribokinase [Chloroflexota bacterium]
MSEGWVIVVGSANIDLTVRVDRLPAPGETVIDGVLTQQGGGKGANQACAAARFGATTRFVGAVGDDDMGAEALDGLRSLGVDVSGVARVPGAATGVALITVDPAGENQIAVASGANGMLDGLRVSAALEAIEAPAGSVLLAGFEIPDDACLAAARWADAHEARFVLNPAPARGLADGLLAARPILTPNETEAAQLAGSADPAVAARTLAARTGAPVVVTLGADGALLFDPARGVVERVPAPQVEALDATGAGDTLSGVLAACLASGAPVLGALSWAVTAAAVSTTGVGARGALPERAEVGILMGIVTGG